MKIEADQDACLAYGNCVAAAPDLFDLTGQKVAVIDHQPPETMQAAARKAVRRCPVKALRILED